MPIVDSATERNRIECDVKHLTMPSVFKSRLLAHVSHHQVARGYEFQERLASSVGVRLDTASVTVIVFVALNLGLVTPTKHIHDIGREEE